jgi:hypothetical protein
LTCSVHSSSNEGVLNRSQTIRLYIHVSDSTSSSYIEVVHSLDTDSFINALQRFICRRGQVRGIRSDNGSNFVCAAKELKFNQSRIHNFLRERSVEWSFNPPAASHMGGAWERQIRTVRKVIDGVTKQQTRDWLSGSLTIYIRCEVDSNKIYFNRQ